MGMAYDKRLTWDLDTKCILGMMLGSKKDHSPSIG